MSKLIEHRMIQETKAANSFEFGKAGKRHKIYYEDKAEMERKIKEAIEGENFLIKLQSSIGGEGD